MAPHLLAAVFIMRAIAAISTARKSNAEDRAVRRRQVLLDLVIADFHRYSPPFFSALNIQVSQPFPSTHHSFTAMMCFGGLCAVGVLRQPRSNTSAPSYPAPDSVPLWSLSFETSLVRQGLMTRSGRGAYKPSTLPCSRSTISDSVADLVKDFGDVLCRLRQVNR